MTELEQIHATPALSPTWSCLQWRRGLALLAPLLVGLATAQLAVAQAPFDGEWRVESVRQEGQCIERSSYMVSINDGVMTAKVTGRLGDYTYSGRVSEDGSFEARLQGKFDSVSVRGLLTGDKGEARWASVSKCLGTMTLERVK